MSIFDGITDHGPADATVLGKRVKKWHMLDIETMVIYARIDDSPPIQAHSGIYRCHPLEILAEILNDLNQRGIKLEPGIFLLKGASDIADVFSKGPNH